MQLRPAPQSDRLMTGATGVVAAALSTTHKVELLRSAAASFPPSSLSRLAPVRGALCGPTNEGNMTMITDEELDELLCAVEVVLPAQRGALRAHIAALTAERDEAKQEASDDAASLRGVLAERDAMRAEAHAAAIGLLEIAKLLTDDEKEPALDAARRVVSERNAFRARVWALEVDLGMAREAVEPLFPGMNFQWSAAKSLLGNLDEQRADAEAQALRWKVMHADTAVALGEARRDRDAIREHVRALEAEKKAARERYAAALDAQLAENAELQRECNRTTSRLSAIRQRAGDTKALVEAHQSGMGCASVARYILGADDPAQDCPLAPPCDPETPGVFECGRGCTCRCHAPVSELDGMRGEMADPNTLNPDATSEADQPLPEGPLFDPSTTTEAFAAVRAMVTGVPRDTQPSTEDGERALSLLERRMGAMERELDRHAASEECRESILVDGDAPPVFTLEEVKDACAPFIGDGPTLAVLERLTALRK